MNAAAGHERFSEDVGAYLLGALDPGEERAFEDHLDTCEDCQQEVERLMMAVEALPRSVDPLVPPPELKASLMATVKSEAVERHASAPARERRRGVGRLRELLVMRPAFAGAAAALLLLVGIGAGAVIGGGGGDDGGSASQRVASVDTSRLSNGAKATLVVPKHGAGAMLRVSGMPLPVQDDVYEVWVQRGKQLSPVSLFDVTRNGDGTAAIPGSLDGVDAVYVTREKRGGATQPTEKPVVSVPLGA
jgi:anti-sigma-K factor RskA